MHIDIFAVQFAVLSASKAPKLGQLGWQDQVAAVQAGNSSAGGSVLTDSSQVIKYP